MKVFITRDELDDWIWLWKKPTKGNWEPSKKKDCNIIVWQREDLNEADAYTVEGFEKKFGFIINKKMKKNIKLNDDLVNSENFKLFSNDPKRKK